MGLSDSYPLGCRIFGDSLMVATGDDPLGFDGGETYTVYALPGLSSRCELTARLESSQLSMPIGRGMMFAGAGGGAGTR